MIILILIAIVVLLYLSNRKTKNKTVKLSYGQNCADYDTCTYEKPSSVELTSLSDLRPF